MFDLTGKVAVVTGAGRGIGAAIARSMAARGARVSLLGRSQAVLQTLASSLGGTALAVSADVTDRAAVDAAFAQARAHAASQCGGRARPTVASAVSITRSGRTAFNRIAALGSRIEARLLARLSESERTTLDSALTRLEGESARIDAVGWRALLDDAVTP